MMFEIEDVSVVRQEKLILEQISIQIHRDSSYAIVGPSGAGKTTLLRLFNFMTIPTSGKIRFNDKNIFEYSPIEYRRRIPIVFQEPVLFEGTVEDNLYAPFHIKKWKLEKPTSGQLKEALSICQLDSHYLYENSQVLSGGEKQRIAMARALLMAPEIILLDEPTSALDPETASNIIDRILNITPMITLIIVTHATDILKKTKYKIVLKKGRIENISEDLNEFE